MLPTWFWRQLGFKRKLPVSWLLLSVLVCANVIVFATLWSLISGRGKASSVLSSQHDSFSALTLLHEPTLTLQPTPTATKVVVYVATATVTPTPSPTQPPTATRPLPATPVATSTVAPPEKEIERVVIISIDGLRPDALRQANTPTLDNLQAKGVYCPQAQTVLPSKTLPGHASMLSGMIPDKHGIQWSMPYIGWPGMAGPTLFNVAHEAGLKTAMVFGKEKLNYIIIGNSVDDLFGKDAHDLEVKQQAVKIIQTDMPHVLFIHFPDTDTVGHDYGWMSANQFDSITFVDGLIGQVVAALEQEGYLAHTLLIITADHGGHGKGHGDDSPLDRTIPWLAVGPEVPQGVILTQTINTYDTAATAAYALKLSLPEIWDGQPVMEIFKAVPRK